ncbi:MAG: YeeE/YedE family protein [Saprospiraceae bacterium]|nr:YeeE/YedE family protein [Saprospiraceae bacterium]MCB9318162.1 YeeE/YedE family protein [Lewinellaceae bacterium]
MIEFISQPWHWAVGGVCFALIIFLMTWLGRMFGISSIFRNICTMAGAGERFSYFKVNLKEERWRLVFVLGIILGGYIAAHYLASPAPVAISPKTVAHLQEWNIDASEGDGFLPVSIFNFSNPFGILLAVIGGFLVGFGTRYADGCTSGHAMTGLSHLQVQSLIAVIGFFIGGLIMTWLILPLLIG